MNFASLAEPYTRICEYKYFAAWEEHSETIAHAEFSKIKRHYATIDAPHARDQVAIFYKRWFDMIAAAPKAGRSMAMFQDLSGAYALGKSLSELGGEGTARRPEAVAAGRRLLAAGNLSRSGHQSHPARPAHRASRSRT